MKASCLYVHIAAIALLLAIKASGTLADDNVSGLSFWRDDWLLACDNTRTCRAAGYQSDDQKVEFSDPVSVLLTRKAGANEPLTGQLALGVIDDSKGAVNHPATHTKLDMLIDGKSSGPVLVRDDSGYADFSASQVKALLAALHKDTKIEWTGEQGQHWWISGKGAMAVLLKMDEFQGRIGTQSAIVAKGANTGSELPPLPPPAIVSAIPLETSPQDRELAKSKKLLEALRANDAQVGEDIYCVSLGDAEPKLSIERLSSDKLLVSTECWLAAYNAGIGYWVINQSPPFSPQIVTLSGSEHNSGRIFASQKGRGLGDCWNSDAWVWDGKAFIHSESSSTGLCRGFAGGAWELPTLVTEVH